MGKQLKVYRNFSGGLSEVANDNMKDNELVMAQNAEPSSTYGIQRCSGTSAYSRLTFEDDGETLYDSGAVKYIIPFTAYMEPTGEDPYFQEQLLALSYDETGANYAVYVKNLPDGEWYHNSDGWVLSDVKGYFSFANKLYFLTGNGIERYQWDDTEQGYKIVSIDAAQAKSETTVTWGSDVWQKMWASIETAVSVVQRGSRWLYATGRDEIWYTKTGEPFGILGAVNAVTQDNDKLTALHLFNDNVLIFKKNSVFQLSGWDYEGNTDLVMSRLNVATGADYPNSIATIDNAVLFLSSDGLYKLSIPYYSSVTAAENISLEKARNRLVKDKGAPVDARGVTWNSTYYLSLTFADGSVEEYRYHTKDKSFWGPYTSGALCYMPYADNRDYLYIGLNNGYIAYYDDTQSSFFDPDLQQQSTIPMIVKTKAFDVVGVMFQNSKVKKAFVAAKQYADQSSGLYIQIKADYADEAKTVDQESYEHMIGDALSTKGISFDESLVWQEGEWWEERWGWNDTVCKQLPIGRKTKHFQFILKSNETNPLVIYGLGLQYKRKKVKGDTKGVSNVEVQD